MSKFLNMGFTLEQVVAMATVSPARIINRAPKLGTLQVGAPADVSLLEVVEGPVEFVDTREQHAPGQGAPEARGRGAGWRVLGRAPTGLRSRCGRGQSVGRFP